MFLKARKGGGGTTNTWENKVYLAKEEEVTSLVSPSCISRYPSQQWSHFREGQNCKANTPVQSSTFVHNGQITTLA